MKKILSLLLAIGFILSFAAPANAATSSSGGSRTTSSSSLGSGRTVSIGSSRPATSSSSGSGARTTSGGYKPPAVGTRVVVSQATSTRPAVTAKVPPPQTTGAGRRTTYGTPYSPSGHTLPSGRAAVYSPVTHSYVAVNSYFYSSYSMFGWHPFYGYYGCLYCWSGAYSYAPIPFAPVAYTQPSWMFDFELLLLVAGLLFGLVWLGRWWGRRGYGPRVRRTYYYDGGW